MSGKNTENTHYSLLFMLKINLYLAVVLIFKNKCYLISVICPVIHLFLGLFNLSVVDFSAFRSLLCRVKDLPLLVCSFYTRRFMFWLQKKKLNIIKIIELCNTCIVVFKNKKMAGVNQVLICYWHILLHTSKIFFQML